MIQAESVLSTPPLNTSRLQIIHEQEAARDASLAMIRRMRIEARDEIDRLLAFLDASDTYVMNEREENGDEADASYPVSGAHVAHPIEDDEDSDSAEEDDAAEDNHDREEDQADNEPSLGWTERGVFGDMQDMELS